MSVRKCCLRILLLSFFSICAFAGVDVHVYDETVYLYLDKLQAAGLLRSYMPNQRPLAREVIVNLIAEARENIARQNGQAGGLDFVIRELESEFPRQPEETKEKGFEFTPLDSAALSFAVTNQAGSITPSNGLGYTAGYTQPLFSRSDGEHYDKYVNAYFSTVHKVKASPYVAAYVQPKFYAKQGDDNGGVGLYRGYARARFGDLDVTVGRDDLRWGPGENSLLFNGNARAMDMIKVSSPEAFRFPGIFKHAGYFRGTAFVSWLRDDFHPTGTKLSGWRLDYSPFKWASIGFDHVVFIGGQGAVSPSATQAIKYFIGFLGQSGYEASDTNHLIGPDFTVRAPQAMGMEVYGKMLFEDTQTEIRYMLESDVAYLAGIHLPAVRGLERLSLRTEFHYTGQYPYTHWFYTDGFSLDNQYLGYDAGPDTYSGTVTARWQFNLEEFIKLDMRYLRRSNDHYYWIMNDAGDNNIGICRGLNLPKETRFIIRVGGQKNISPDVALSMEAGYDRRRNADFTEGNSVNEFFLRIRMLFRGLNFKS